jgi:hypothetical protein
VRESSSLPPVFTVPKVEGQRNEDRYQRSSRGIFALSDGASISFDSASWARILVRRFTQKPEFTREWLSEAIAEFGKLHDRGRFRICCGLERIGPGKWRYSSNIQACCKERLLHVAMLHEKRQ